MILTSGATATLKRLLPAAHLGYLLTPDICKPSHVRLARRSGCWAADNSAFANFSPARYCGFLEQISRIPGCLWVTCPDVVADSKATVEQLMVRQRHPGLGALRGDNRGDLLAADVVRAGVQAQVTLVHG